MSIDYRVRLEQVFQGPMDLLLHLVREQEVEIHDVQISLVLEGYMTYLKSLEALDIEYAGEFLVMAATLMAIKSRSLLPKEEIELDDELDPRDELITRLLEYKRFKEASQDLEDRAIERALLFPRGYRGEAKEHQTEPMLDMGDLSTWDLLAHYSRLMRETAAGRAHHVAGDARPMRYYVESMAHRIKAMGRMTLASLVEGFEDGVNRETVIGSFCALLELVKMGLVTVVQDEVDDEIQIDLRPEHAEDIDDVLRASKLEDEEQPDDPGAAGPEPGEEAHLPFGGHDDDVLDESEEDSDEAVDEDSAVDEADESAHADELIPEPPPAH